ncbi:MAG: hypothetical protein ABI600_06755 [Luteolibacter sp.]
MAALETRLIDYLQSITGEPPDLQRVAVERAAGLPLFLRERYRIHTIRLFGKKCLLALEATDWESGSPAEYGSHANILHEKLGEPVVIVIPSIASYARNRMVHGGVPFIVPGTQLFLPFLMVDLRERFARIQPAAGKSLTPATQCILLFHLLRESLDGIPLREIAGKVGYSAMMISRAKDEMEAAELCRAISAGRSMVLEFSGKGRSLWQRAEALLSSPVRKIRWIRWDQPAYPAVVAGLTALSRRTMIEDDRLPTWALMHDVYRANLEMGVFRGCPSSDDANVQLESWGYNPLLLGGSEAVDSLSLYLSMRDSADERIQQQLKQLIGEVNWA